MSSPKHDPEVFFLASLQIFLLEMYTAILLFPLAHYIESMLCKFLEYFNAQTLLDILTFNFCSPNILVMLNTVMC